MHPVTYDAGDRKSVRRAEKDAKAVLESDRATITNLMSHSMGRWWMSRQLEACHIFADPFTGQALHEAYLKGERNFGLRLLAQLMAFCPDQYLLMMREANARNSLSERSSDTNHGRNDTGSVEASRIENDFDPFDSSDDNPGPDDNRRYVHTS